MANSSYFIHGGDVVTETGVLSSGCLLIKDGKLVRVREKLTPPKDAESIDVSGRLVFPGFIDMHIHGAGGVDSMSADLAGLEKMSQVLARCGTTSFLPTLRSAPIAKITQVLDTVHQMKETKVLGAKVGGVHLEGPMLNPQRRGIHTASSLGMLTIDIMERMLTDYGGFLKMVTFAPELDKDLELCRYLHDNNVLVSLGHSNADYPTTRKAIENGLSYAVHVYNAMPHLHHRNPGPLGALLTDERVSCEVIADGRHVHMAALKILYKCKGAKRIVLATDAMMALGTRLTRFSLERKELIIRKGVPVSAKGVIAGSLLTLPRAVLFFSESSDCPLHEAANMASLNPARLLGWDKQLGSLAEGKQADVVITDKKGKVETVFIDGIRL